MEDRSAVLVDRREGTTEFEDHTISSKPCYVVMGEKADNVIMSECALCVFFPLSILSAKGVVDLIVKLGRRGVEAKVVFQGIEIRGGHDECSLG